MRSHDDIAHEFKLKYGLAPSEPTGQQLEDILSRSATWEADNNKKIDDHEIGKIVRTVCDTADTYKYASMGYSQMRDLLVILQSLRSAK